MSDQPTGIDVSSHNPGIDWKAAGAGGLDFAFIKVTEGMGYRNPLFADQWAGAKAAGVARGAYHFYVWNYNPHDQADWFLRNVPADDRGELPLTVDVENSGDGAGIGVKDPTYIRQFCDAIKAATGRSPIIYTYPSMWRDVLGDPQNFGDCPLWLAAYVPSTPHPVGGWNALTFWQTTASARVAGVPGTVDADVYVGSMDEFRALAGQTDPQSKFFPETGHYIAHGFLDLWNKYGLSVCGFPLSEEYKGTDGATYQDCENVMFRYTGAEGPRICAAVRMLKYGH